MAKKKNTKQVWMRAGVTLSMTDKEYDIIMSGGENIDHIIKEILDRGDFEFNGDSYIPESEMESCNKRYNTDYETGDMTVEL